MALFTNFGVGLFLVGGLSAAIGLPLSMNAKKGRSATTSSSHTGGGVGQVDVSQCKESRKGEGSPISFGSKRDGNICGAVESGTTEENPEEYSSLFRDRGDSKNEGWNNSEERSQGTNQCMDKSESWMATNSEGGVQYLGLCGDTTVEETKFVKKVQERHLVGNEEAGTLGICKGGCGAPNVEAFGGTPRALKEKEGEPSNGKKVLFYKS